ncbi:MAG TPA: hypothetical protein ENI39_04895 [Anaerolineae bacterium]|nr:hypothetical protein [Anaerolineae bacterium]
MTAWSAGQSDSVGYWILAQDDPPEPWAELGLRTGLTFLDFEGSAAGSPDNFAGGGVWTTRWHGIAPTAWLYFALTPGEPFPEEHRVWLPLVLRNHLE